MTSQGRVPIRFKLVVQTRQSACFPPFLPLLLTSFRLNWTLRRLAALV